jgi:type I restriction enzyme S subunit
MLNNFKKYPSYIDSEIEWAGLIPSHWDILKLKHIFSEKKIKHNPSLSCGSISFGEVVYKNDETVPESTKASYQEVLEGEFLINPLNLNYDLKSLRIALSELNVVVSSGYIVLNNHAEINKRYYKYLLHVYDVAYMKLLGSGVRQTINFNHISSSLLAYPPLKEQTAIANFLDKKTAEIKEFIALKEKTIELLKERKMAIINELVTGKKVWDGNAWTEPTEVKDSGIEWLGEIPKHWEVKKLKYLSYCKNNQRIPIESSIRGQMKNPRYDYYGATGVIDKVDDFIFDEDLILIAEDGANLLMRNIQLVYIAKGKYWVNNHAHIFKPRQNMNIEFLANCMEVFDYSTLISGSAQPKLTKYAILNIPLIQPPFKEQNEIMEYVHEISTEIIEVISNAEREINLIKEYEQSLISEVVTGKVDVSSFTL